jgi:sulfate/thiosulfate transport system permease protein
VTRRRFIPGFGLTLGFTVFYLCVIVLLPLSFMVARASSLTWAQFWAIVMDPRTLASLRVTLATSLGAALVNAVMGFVVAWSLVRYQFPGKRIVDAMVDLPFALPTAVSGIALTAIYSSNGWLGSLLEPLGIRVAFTPLGITVALIFIGLPFVVRAVQPAIEDLDPAVEEAAGILGAGRWQTFLRVILPATAPALITGFTMAFARAVGEYGSVVFISGNMPLKTEIVSLLIIAKLEQFDYAGATALGTLMLALSFVMLLAINSLQWWAARRYQGS